MKISTRQDKREKLIEYITGGIRDGRLRSGEQLPTERELAAEFQTTPVTVGRAMRELVEAKIIERRVGAGSFVTEYGIRLISSTTVNVLTTVLDIEPVHHFRELCTAMIRKYGWEPNVIRIGADSLTSAIAAARLFPYTIVLHSHFAEDSAFKRMLLSHSRLSILVGAVDRSVFDVVIRGEDSAAIHMAVEHLRSRGCRSIGLIAEPPNCAIHELLIALWRSTQPVDESFSDTRLITIGDKDEIFETVRSRLQMSSFDADGLICPLPWVAEICRAFTQTAANIPVPIVALDRAGNVPEGLDTSMLSGVVSNDLGRHVRIALELIRRNIEVGWKPAETQRMHIVPPRFHAFP